MEGATAFAQIMEGLQAIKYRRGALEVLDQLRLPHEFVYENVVTCEEAFDCIKSMRVRGERFLLPFSLLLFLSSILMFFFPKNKRERKCVSGKQLVL